jgi:hypothetical protein
MRKMWCPNHTQPPYHPKGGLIGRAIHLIGEGGDPPPQQRPSNELLRQGQHLQNVSRPETALGVSSEISSGLGSREGRAWRRGQASRRHGKQNKGTNQKRCSDNAPKVSSAMRRGRSRERNTYNQNKHKRRRNRTVEKTKTREDKKQDKQVRKLMKRTKRLRTYRILKQQQDNQRKQHNKQQQEQRKQDHIRRTLRKQG